MKTGNIENKLRKKKKKKLFLHKRGQKKYM